MIIGVTGRRGSGKDTVADYLKDRHGFSALDFTRDVLSSELKKRGLAVTRDNLISLAMEGRRKAHNGIWAEKLSDVVKAKGKGDFVISGVRFMEEVETFKKHLGEDFILISVICDDKARHERCRKRGTKGEANLTFEEFMAKDERPTEKAILKTMRDSDYAVDNNGTISDLYSQIDKIIKALKENR